MIPHSFKNLRDWLKLQIDDVAGIGSACGMTGPEIIAYLASANLLHPKVAEIVTLMETLDEKTDDLEPHLATQLPLMRKAIARAKTHPGCIPSTILQMQWKGDAQEFNEETARPNIKLTAMNGRVKVEGNKPGFEAYNLYSRIKGQVAWKPIAIRKRKFPYYDDSALAVPNTPEVREYMAMGVINDEEVGVPSEIKEVVYAG